MFGKSRKAVDAVAGLNFTQAAKDPSSYILGELRELGLGSELSAFTYGEIIVQNRLSLSQQSAAPPADLALNSVDPVQSLLAVGTEHGRLFIFGGPAVELSWDLGIPVKIKHLAFLAGRGFLCIVGELCSPRALRSSKLTRGSTSRCQGHTLGLRPWPLGARQTCTRFLAQSAQQYYVHAPQCTMPDLFADTDVFRCVETSASHPFLFLGGKDGTVDVFDVDRGSLATQARIPNLWLAQEEILRRSGVIDAPSRRHM